MIRYHGYWPDRTGRLYLHWTIFGRSLRVYI